MTQEQFTDEVLDTLTPAHLAWMQEQTPPAFWEYYEFCPVCQKLSAYSWDDVNDELSIAHIGTASCFDWACGHCQRTWAPVDSPILHPCYTHK
jgi:hypothetical protein